MRDIHNTAASPQDERVKELDRLLRLHDHAIATPSGYLDMAVADASLRRQAGNVVAKATNLDAEGERYISAFRLIHEKGFEAFSGESGKILRDIATHGSDAYNVIVFMRNQALGEGALPSSLDTTQHILRGMKSAAEEIAQRRPEDHPACDLEELGELKPDSGSCVGKKPALSRK